MFALGESNPHGVFFSGRTSPALRGGGVAFPLPPPGKVPGCEWVGGGMTLSLKQILDEEYLPNAPVERLRSVGVRRKAGCRGGVLVHTRDRSIRRAPRRLR